MRLKWFVFVVFSGFSSIFCDDDPCQNSQELHSIEGRSPNSSANIPCDAYISEGWYKTARYDMVSINPGIGKCGSIFPIYLKENITDNSNILHMNACMVGPGDNCAEIIQVKVKNCDADRAYYLKPTKSCDSTYCFGKTREYSDAAPTWIPNTVSVSTEINFTKTTPEYFFKCSFNMPPDKLLYKIYWYVNSKKIKNTGFIEEDEMQINSYLFESDLLRRGLKLNIMISCGVVAAKSRQGEPGTLKKSIDFFAGIKFETVLKLQKLRIVWLFARERHKCIDDYSLIKVVTKTITIEAGKTANAVLQPTIPIPCPTYLPYLKCDYQIWMYDRLSKNYKCGNNAKIGSNRCGLNMEGRHKNAASWFKNKKWNKNLTLEVKHRKDLSSYQEKKFLYTLQLRLADTQLNKLWSGSLIDDIKVNIVDKSPEIFKEKVCSGQVDPHMRTFDGNQFEMQLRGLFLMYRHKKYNTTVQVKTTRCTNRPNIYCFCGVVIRAGRDVFMIYMCPDLPTKIDRFIRCQDGLLSASSRGGSEYQIYLPTGTQVKIKMDKYYQSGSFINVFIYPTMLDLHETDGLCGIFDNKFSNDFKLRDGNYTNQLQKDIHPKTPPYSTFVNDFSESWRLSDAENLFPHSGVDKKYDSLQPMDNSIQFCYCRYNDIETKGVNVTTILQNEAQCDFRQYASCKDKRNRELTCRYHKDKKRSIMKINRDPDIFHGIDKRAVSKTYTESEAYEACNKVFEKAELIRKCSGANLIDNSSLALCVIDFMITGDDRWIHSHSDSARSQCMHEVEYNNTLREDQPDLVSEITNLNCQNNCSNQGLCINGTCQCNEGYLDTDCSVNIAEPPPIHDTSHGPLCDKSKDDCQEIDLYGESFLYEYPPALRIQRYTITSTNEKKLSGSFLKTCTWRGQFEVTCSFHENRKKRNTVTKDTFATQYTYSISNDGKHYSNEMTLHVMDSSCQEIKNNSNEITFYLKEKHCFIEGVCYRDNENDQINTCNICSSEKDKYAWTVSNEGDCISKTPVDSDPGKAPLIIGLSVAASIIFVVIIVAGIVIVKYNRKPALKLENKNIYGREPSSCRDFEIFQANTNVKKSVDETGIQLKEQK